MEAPNEDLLPPLGSLEGFGSGIVMKPLVRTARLRVSSDYH